MAHIPPHGQTPEAMSRRALGYGLALAIMAYLLLALAYRVNAQVITTMSSGTLAATNTYQLVLTGNCPAGNSGDAGCVGTIQRNGCTIQNIGSNAMFVHPGPVAGANVTRDFQLSVGSTFNCQIVNGKVISDPIYIAGTMGDGFAAGSQ